MPEPPAGERSLQNLASVYVEADARIQHQIELVLQGKAPRTALQHIHEILTQVLALPIHPAVTAAYLHVRPEAGEEYAATVMLRLATALRKRLHDAATIVKDSSRNTLRQDITTDNVNAMAKAATVAAIDAQGNRTRFGPVAEMNVMTTARHATVQGYRDEVGEGGVLIVNTGECSYCAGFAGEATVGTDPLPPFHPNCTCTVSKK
jgi:hypothetical protein